MWRWSCLFRLFLSWLSVFSTYVEVILKHGQKVVDHGSFLHVCGGDPSNASGVAIKMLFSPRMWRWSLRWLPQQLFYLVFSTYVEVILTLRMRKEHENGFLHVCGGDPTREFTSLNRLLFSPRMWRWSWGTCLSKLIRFVFSTYVEVIYSCNNPCNWTSRFLHVCGGDPVT